MYSFSKTWHICKWFEYSKDAKLSKQQMTCHCDPIKDAYESKLKAII
jgi:hypothetical protein